MAVRWLFSVLIGAVLLLVPSLADCQQYGQWTWGAVIGAEDRSTDNFIGDEDVSKYRTRAYFLGLGVNGFVLHPAVARFSLRLDTWYTQFPEGTGNDNVRFGGRFDLGLFERSAFPMRLYFGRTQYDYPNLATADPITLLSGLPDSTTSWGGRLRIRRGILRGLLVGVDSTELGFHNEDRQTETVDRYFGDWSRSGKRIQHHVRLVHEARDYARLDYAFDTTTLTWDEHGRLAPSWRWDLSAVGIRRTRESEGVGMSESDTASLRNRFVHDLSDGSSLNLSYGFGYASAGNSESALDHSIEGRYRRIVGLGWEISPFAAYSWREIGEGNGSVLQGGLSANRNWASGAWDSNISGQGSYGQSMRSSPGWKDSQSFWFASVASALGHGNSAGLRKELEFSISRNEVGSVGDGNIDLPDLGVGFAAAGAQDTGRVRFSLFHDWAGGNVSAWAEWRRREADSLVDETRLRAEDLLMTTQLRWRRLSVAINGGTTEIDDFHSAGQEMTYYGGSLTWNPWRSVHAIATYREDYRRLALAPDVDSDRIQATIEFRMGRLSLRGEVYQYTERPEFGTERRNRGIFWSVRRGFSGWLPIVSGPQRRGVIR
ncbi:MAG: hypothetical protein K8R59_01195 [Thermoanaerobaculales bacterium]|nr:hypothetical protein [Thermoanaerobaculales bacterium]